MTLPNLTEGRDDFAELLAAIGTSEKLQPVVPMAEKLADMGRLLSAAFLNLAPHATPMAARKAQSRDIALLFAACSNGTAIACCNHDQSTIIAILTDEVPGVAAQLTGEAGDVFRRRGAATALELRLARLLIEECAKAAGCEAGAAKLAEAAGRDITAWQGVAIALAEARGKGGAPVLWGLQRFDDSEAPGKDRSGPGKEVRQRLGQAEASLHHAMPIGRRPFRALRELRAGDVMELGMMDQLTLVASSNGQPVHMAVPDIKNGRLIARVTRLAGRGEGETKNG